MERRARFRTGIFIALIVLIMAIFTFRLYALQTSLTEEEIRTSNSLTIQTTVDASRGQILDRNGKTDGEAELKQFLMELAQGVRR